jgi:V/A-type H+-transporting ATPase subunit I
MFSTKNIYRFAVLVQKKEAEATVERLVSLGLLHPKKVEQAFDGPFSPRAAKKALPYEKQVGDLIRKIEGAGVSCKGTVKVQDEEKFLDALIRDIGALGKKADDGKAAPEDLLRLKAGEELLEYKKAVADIAKGTEMADGFVIIEGWIDKDSLEGLRESMDGPSMLFEYVEPGDGPTLLKNPWPFSLFEYVSKLYPPFSYGSIDITPVITITFPIIFGLMFASVIDGLILLAVAAFLWNRSKGETPQLIAILALAAILFGFLFGESGPFGTAAVIPVYENPMLLIVISIGVGFVHITIGHILGILNSLAENSRREAFAHVGYILLMLSGLGYFLSVPFSLAGGAVGLVLILNGGAKSISEIPHALGHLFSYARIFAISISHYSIAKVFDALAAKFAWTSPQGIIISLLILASGHFILVTVELLIALIHTLRLHVLEFGTKFMVTGKDWFKPYKMINRYVEVV